MNRYENAAAPQIVWGPPWVKVTCPVCWFSYHTIFPETAKCPQCVMGELGLIDSAELEEYKAEHRPVEERKELEAMQAAQAPVLERMYEEPPKATRPEARVVVTRRK